MKDMEIAKEICKKMDQKHKGMIVAVEVESREFFLGETEMEAYQRAVNKYPNKQFVFQRVGFPTTHFIGVR